jgi:HSP20 family molecular chaperone IbpA
MGREVSDLGFGHQTMFCRGDVVTLYKTHLPGLWLVDRKARTRIMADHSSAHRVNVWEFDDGRLRVIADVPALNPDDLHDTWVRQMHEKHDLLPIRIEFLPYRKPEIHRR